MWVDQAAETDGSCTQTTTSRRAACNKHVQDMETTSLQQVLFRLISFYLSTTSQAHLYGVPKNQVDNSTSPGIRDICSVSPSARWLFLSPLALSTPPPVPSLLSSCINFWTTYSTAGARPGGVKAHATSASHLRRVGFCSY